MSSGRLYLYRFIEDAWAGGLGDWCRGSEGVESWLLVENAGQERWFSRKFALEGIEGVQIFDADRLREELGRRGGIQAPDWNGTVAAFAVKVAVQSEQGDAALTVMRNAGQVAEACDELARAGWHLGQLNMDGSIARRIHQAMEKELVLPGIVERRLREGLPRQRAFRHTVTG